MLSFLTMLASCGLLFLSSLYWYNIIWALCFCSLVSMLLIHGHGMTHEISSTFMATDSMSILLICLSVWISLLMLLVSQGVYLSKKNQKQFLFLVLALMVVLSITFSASDVILFYFMFEFSLIPTLLLILGWGYQPERVQAGMYMMMYTLLASLPLLVAAVWVSSWSCSGKMLLTHMLRLSQEGSMPYGVLICGVLFLAFLVKLPVFPVHLWLPKAHVEAPVAGSMVLAAVLLKLGGYGLLRMYQFMGCGFNLTVLVFLSIGFYGGAMSSIVCFRQVDLKALIAYSSVGHMSFVLLGMLSDTAWGISGGLLLMLAHGFCSSALFSLSGYMYSYLSTRSIILTKGLLSLSPSFTLWWFLTCITNMAAPPTINLMGELMVFISCFFCSWIFLIPGGMMMFLSCVYSMYLYTSTQHGSASNYLNSLSGFSASGNLALLLHMLPSVALILSVASVSLL